MAATERSSGPGPGYLEGIASAAERNRRDGEIEWREWGREPFDIAAAEDKLVLLDLTAPWCHWCHVMDETTYFTPEVITFINRNLVAIRVDADRHPEVEKAYLSGGWPTTALLLPSGEALSGMTYVPPDEMIKWMVEVVAVYRKEKDDILGQVAAHRAGFLAQTEMASRASGIPPLDEAARAVLESAADNYDEAHGGWGDAQRGFAPKFPQPNVIELLISRMTGKPGPDERRMLETTLRNQRGIIDPVWGGFCRYSVDRPWRTPHYEKMLADQAKHLRNYLHLWQATGESWALDVCCEIARYIRDWLTGPDWELWASQDADVGSHDGAARFIPGEEYFHLGDEERRTLGVPFVEEDVIANWTAEAAGALIEYGAATGARNWLLCGIAALEGIWSNLLGGDGFIRHSLARKNQPQPILPDQVAFGLAALAAHYATGDGVWISRAAKLAAAIIALFEDKTAGGFYFTPFDEKALGNLLYIGKPFDENVAAAAFLSDLSWATGDDSLRESAAKALAQYAGLYQKYGYMAAGYCLALAALEGAGTRIIVVHPADCPKLDEIAAGIARVWSPGKIVRFVAAAKGEAKLGKLVFPASGQTQVYVCRGKACSAPISPDSADFEERLRSLLHGD